MTLFKICSPLRVRSLILDIIYQADELERIRPAAPLNSAATTESLGSAEGVGRGQSKILDSKVPAEPRADF